MLYIGMDVHYKMRIKHTILAEQNLSDHYSKHRNTRRPARFQASCNDDPVRVDPRLAVAPQCGN